ncbi:MAG TPA: tetratricopeptide repeat protein [Candidatus Lokiarchaeia archaeon]|nr:tetratricopeptide repeat protein [Candidatus Lokiarchaeia archaeon]
MSYEDDFEEAQNALQEHNLATAYRLLKKCTATRPGDYNAFLYLGIVLTEMGEYRDALATFKQCMNIDDKAPHAYSNMGIVYQKMNNLDEALRHFYKATKLDPTDINTRLNLGITFYKTHNKELDALQEFKYVVEQDDTIPDAWHYLGLIFMDMQKKEFALHCFLKAKELGFDDAEKNNELIRDLKFDGIVAMNPLDDDVKDTAFITNKKDVSKR